MWYEWIYTHLWVCMYVSTLVFIYVCIHLRAWFGMDADYRKSVPSYAVATITRLLKSIGLFCKRAL